MNGFTDHLYTRLVSASNYNATTNLCDSKIATAPVSLFPACCVTSRLLATASNSGDSSASIFTDSREKLNQLNSQIKVKVTLRLTVSK
jgi:hypothetical protein